MPKEGTVFSILGNLFREMDTGTKGDQLGLIKQASKSDWAKLESSIFGEVSMQRTLATRLDSHAVSLHHWAA